MSKTWLILDVNFLGHRALHSTGNLSYGNDPTGVLYGILRDVFALREHFGSDHVVWCFDSPKQGGVREKLEPSYNDKRKNAKKTPEQIQQTIDLHKQLRRLRKDILPQVVPYVSYYKGYEADDCIAWAVREIPKQDTAIIISADKDLYQLIRAKRPKVIFYNPNKMQVMDKASFKKQYNGLSPKRWDVVKAIAGCATDGVIGIPSVGEATAVKYLTNALPSKYKAYKAIIKGDKIRKRNMKLVSLPFYKLPPNYVDPTPYGPEHSEPDPKPGHKKWKKVFKKLGIKSL